MEANPSGKDGREKSRRMLCIDFQQRELFIRLFAKMIGIVIIAGVQKYRFQRLCGNES